MKHLKIVSFIFISLLALSCLFLLQNVKGDVIKSKYFNYVEKGGKTVKTSPSTQYKLMETYSQATVTVYEVGTTDLAIIWADRDGLILKANPFTADVDSFYYFYVDCGKYDIKFSGDGIAAPYTYGDVSICGDFSGGSGGTVTGTGTENFITKWISDTEIGDSVLFNPSNVQAGSTTLIGWTSGLPTDALNVALGRNSSEKLEINNGTLGQLRDLTLHRIEPIPTSTIPGLNFGTIATDPSAPVAGDCWYNTTSDTFKCFNDTTNVFLNLVFADDTFIDFTQTNNSVTATLTDAIKIASYTLFFSASNETLETADGPLVIVPDFAGEIVGWTVYEKGNVSGSVSFSVDKVTPTYPITVAPTFASMVGVGNKPALSSQIANRANVSSWTTTTFAQGDIIRVSVDSSPTSVVNVFVEFKVRRTGL